MKKSPLLNVITSTLQKVARDLIRDFGEVENLQVSRKGAGDFVSQADKQSEERLIYLLGKARPRFDFLAEESGAKEAEDSGEVEGTWIIDPLDGTSNFLHGLPHFCITVAVKKNDDIIAGATYDPIRDEMFMAEKGGGAFLNNRRLRVSERSNLDSSLISVGRLPRDRVHKLEQSGLFLRCTGSTALDMAYIAAGRMDGGIYGHAKPWDVAAGMVLVREAGGFVQNIDSNTPAKWDAEGIIVTNSRLNLRAD